MVSGRIVRKPMMNDRLANETAENPVFIRFLTSTAEAVHARREKTIKAFPSNWPMAAPFFKSGSRIVRMVPVRAMPIPIFSCRLTRSWKNSSPAATIKSGPIMAIIVIFKTVVFSSPRKSRPRATGGQGRREFGVCSYQPSLSGYCFGEQLNANALLGAITEVLEDDLFAFQLLRPENHGVGNFLAVGVLELLVQLRRGVEREPDVSGTVIS